MNISPPHIANGSEKGVRVSMIDPKFIEKIVQAWFNDQEHPHRDRAKRELYPSEIIRRFVEVAFFASFENEEGRPLEFSVVLVSESEATTPGVYHRNKIHTFDHPISFNASSLPKIAPAFDPRLSSLGVTVDEQSKELAVWGVFSFAPSAHTYSGVPVCIVDETGCRPDFLTVSAVGRGSLLLSRGNAVLGRIASGDFVPATPSPFTSHSLGAHWLRFVERTEPWSRHGIPYWGYARDALDVLLKEIAHRSHGGTLVILDATVAPPSDLYASKYILKGDQRLGRLIEKCLPNSSTHTLDALTDIGYRKIAFEELKRVAQLAAVDGALVIDSNFEVLTFGATLKADRWTGNTPIGPDGFGHINDDSFEVGRYGHRHRSALDFAGACDTSIVFVISQDGPIRAFRRTSETTVTCWPDCTASMFAS